ncbi:sulfatase-like hydrolase/transferase [Aliifodinibius salicampi]|uniref:Sulfatase-like hydrolase/transferase n=1 Tax=Fodinibius salicampi TaxID=1920655 RepID=A0ABT3PXZ2_9BACT|nr:sulfatase-like hydrolase/transferase [Fodinibius salicampi]MCW9712733.1 sulfatase-like hydrolase/transferase [Fodinibius salicampi]
MQQPEINQKPPNIIFILTDDLGYGDIGAFYQNQRREEGKPHHKTPNLDRMASEGMRLTRHYVGAPVCAPSRASLLQGVHQGHANIRDNQFDKALSDNHTLASVLKEAGYTTGLVGKYGLQGREGNSPETWQAYPTKRGFDHFFGYVRHRDGHNHYPAHKVRERPKVELYAGNEEISDQLRGAYTTDLFTGAAKKWIIDQEQEDQPFFLYLAYDTPHAGLEVASTRYPEGGGLDGGVQLIGEVDNYINTVGDSIDTYIHPDYIDQGWPEPQQRFASMVRRIDNGVGDIIQLLKDLDIDENTMIVFTSDNGPHRESYGYGEYDPTFFDSFGPLDGIKRDTWEGGIRVPTIAWWPGRVSEGSMNDSPSGFHDWLPTFVEMAGLPAPARTDGVSLLPVLTGENNQHSGEVYVEYNQGGETPGYEEFHESHREQQRGQMQVLYLGGYKGIRYNIQSADDEFRIYDTRQDPGETNDLAASSNNFDTLQQQMKNRVLQIRRPDLSAERPYDEMPVPALVDPGNIQPGLRYWVYEVITPWVPDVHTLEQAPEQSGITERFDLEVRTRDRHIVLEYAGLLEVPETGVYTFSLQADRGAVLRIHDAMVIDADKEYDSGSAITSEIRLEEGYHPVQLIYARAEEDGTPSLQLQWSGPGLSMQDIESKELSHQPDNI